MVRNKVETLRSICFTIEDLSNITNLGDVYTPKDIEFMVEFKKIYELGLTQLKKFIDKLDSEGNEIDEYSIQYYVKILLNGPLGSYVRGYSEGKKYFSNIPDCLGQLGNKTRSISNTTIISNDPVSLGSSVDINNKLHQESITHYADEILLTYTKVIILYFQELEEYEKCAHLKKIQNFLESILN
jgi:hypothetical protein